MYNLTNSVYEVLIIICPVLSLQNDSVGEHEYTHEYT